MPTVNDGGEPVEVPLAYYDEDGGRHVVGKAAVQIKNGEVIALGQIDNPLIPLFGDLFAGNLNLEGFSISAGPFPAVSPAEEASRRLGLLARASREHVTDTNPNGEVRQCDRRDLHDPHEYQAEFGAYFNVFCPGNVGSQR